MILMLIRLRIVIDEKDNREWRRHPKLEINTPMQNMHISSLKSEVDAGVGLVIAIARMHNNNNNN